ncbi:putative anthocyanidin reductase [Salvia splendens]|uniref:putative anthocyanidin reductase n=1 Tax=Salvia splendens TaxID=180675 RepID=UPI001C25C854|nr:putative anthocyanidin reductase [Salvia splendens]XP_042031264.1 putative anthocyanidin reductase [Salvia splendens]XP_042031265.1 putative anthocyanidin reductase [Salvia splendens]XP_042031266.1 putative anthocyanidin reductase [Salvia splendens]
MERVLVTGGEGYLASFLIKKLLERGYIVNATLRNLSDDATVGFLKGLTHSQTRLHLFEADIYNPGDFEVAIQGCAFVFHVATPLQHNENSTRYKNTTEAAVDALKMIAESCVRCKTVKKLIYTASAMAVSPLKDDGSGYKDVVDETCWTPLNLTYYPMFSDYIYSKALTEKEALRYNKHGIEVVCLVCGLIGGEATKSFVSASAYMLLAQAMKDETLYKSLRELENLGSKVAIVHVQDVVEAHIFAMETSEMNGRYLVASDFLKSTEIASLIHKHFPDIAIPKEFIEDTKRETKWDSRKMQDLGFEYKCDADKIICDSIACAKRLGAI